MGIATTKPTAERDRLALHAQVLHAELAARPIVNGADLNYPDHFTVAALTHVLTAALSVNPRASRRVRADCHVLLGDEARMLGAHGTALSHYSEARRLYRRCGVDERIERARREVAAQTARGPKGKGQRRGT